jgi:hypothetical protein
MLTCLLSVFIERLGDFVLHDTAADCRGLPVRVHPEGIHLTHIDLDAAMNPVECSSRSVGPGHGEEWKIVTVRKANLSECQ